MAVTLHLASSSTRRPKLGLVVTALLGLIGVISVGCGGRPGTPDDPAGGPAVVIDEGREMAIVTLYFPGTDLRLHPLAQQVPVWETEAERVEGVVGGVLAGPSAGDLKSAFDQSISVLGVDVIERVAYVDLGLADPTAILSIGTRAEMLAVFSLVNSILVDGAEVDSVIFLWNGVQRPTFAGHIDTSRPLLADPTLIVAAEAPAS